MTNIPTLPEYENIAKILEETQSPFGPSEVHGIFCGLLCGMTEAEKELSWKKIIFSEEKNLQGLELLDELYETSYHLLSDFSFEFDLLLPNDAAELNFRTEALGLWCQGFLVGLQHGNVPIAQRAPSDTTDALNDLVEIAQVRFGEVSENDEDEAAYFELVEYVRLSVLMIFQEVKTEQADNLRNQEDSLH